MFSDLYHERNRCRNRNNKWKGFCRKRETGDCGRCCQNDAAGTCLCGRKGSDGYSVKGSGMGSDAVVMACRCIYDRTREGRDGRRRFQDVCHDTGKQENDENAVDKNGKLITQNPDTEEKETWKTPVVKADISMEKLRDYEYLMSHFYTVDSSTMADEGLINADKLMGKDMKLNPDTKGAKVLIYHTHSQEQFADSVPGDAGTSIVGMGTYLSELLNQKYGISTYHHEGVYDLVNGKLDRSKAYQLAEPDVQKILKENPAIEVVIDLHRDGVAEGTHLVTEIDGKPTAQIMFFNGLSRTRANGNISYLSNPYLEDNLAFSLQMEIAAATYYPGFARHIFLRAYRYNMHFKPKTLLIEAGAQTNTVEEMRNAMEILAELLHQVLS